jgi:hypothetical protein
VKWASGAGSPPQICERTACRWLPELGFVFSRYTKDYVDGHERPDVKQARIDYLAEKLTDDPHIAHVMPPAQEIEQLLRFATEGQFDQLPWVEFSLDECCLTSNDKPKSRWGEVGTYNGLLRAKGEGAGIHICLIINEVQGGPLFWEGEIAAESLEYGRGTWWNSERFINFIRRAIGIRKGAFPWARVIWRFDHSSNHRAKAKDALNVNNMNVGSGGAQPAMHATTVLSPGSLLFGKIQSMVLADGTPKGFRLVLEERWGEEAVAQWKGKAAMAAQLGSEPDFLAEKSILETVIAEACPQDKVVFLPKFHPELMAIERFFAVLKGDVRKECTGSIKDLRKMIPLAMDSVCGDVVRRHFAGCRRFEALYRLALESSEVRTAFRATSSHRRAPENERMAARNLGIDPDDPRLTQFCYCTKCKPDSPPCSAPRCLDHGVAPLPDPRLIIETQRKGQKRKETPSIASKKGGKKRAREVETKDESKGEPKKGKRGQKRPAQQRDESEGEEPEEQQVMYTAVICVNRDCRLWREVSQETIDDIGTEPFTCTLAGLLCGGECGYCGAPEASQCKCSCAQCSQRYLHCFCEDDGDELEF